jgi:putative ABC transport system permease protein
VSRRSRTTTPALLGRALGAQRAPVTVIAVLTLVLAVIGVLTPQLTTALLTKGLRYDVGQATPLQRDLTATFVGAPSGWEALDADLEKVRRSMPTELRMSSATAESVTTSTQMLIREFPGGLNESYVALGAGEQLFPHVRFIAGSAPAPSGSGPLPMALSSSVATALHWRVGATHSIQLADGATRDVRLTGTFVARDRSDGYWGHVFQTLGPRIAVSGTGGRIPIGTGWVAAASLSSLTDLPDEGYSASLQTTVWFPLRTGALTPGDAVATADASRRFTAIRRPVDAAGEAPLSFSTQLSDVIASSRARSATASALADAGLAGPLGAALALELLAARLTIARSREALALIGARGAGHTSLRLTVAGLVAAVSIPAAAVGGFLGLVAASALARGLGVPEPRPDGPIIVTAAVAAILPAVMVGALVPRLVGRPIRFPLRTVAEWTLLAVGAVSVVLVARQGLQTASAGAGTDPVAALLPLVLALCGCVGALRVLPWALERLRRRAARGRGVSASTGLAVAGRSRAGLGAPLLAATVGLAVALFGSVLGTTLEHGVQQAAGAEVGADVRVTTSSLDFTTELPFSRVDGVSDVAFVSDNASATLTAGPRSVTATVIVVDAARLREVQRGVPGAVALPDALTRAPGGSSAVPVVASDTVARRLDGFRPAFGGTPLDVVGRGPDVTSLVSGSSWILVDQRYASELSTDNSAPDQTLLRLAPHADPQAVAGRVRHLVGSSTPVTTTREVEATLAKNPLVPGVRLIALEAAVLGGLFGAAALITTVVLDTGPRRRRIRLLTLIGLDRFQRRRLVVAETLPLGVAALVAGVVVAAAMVALVLPSADLRSFTGGTTRPGIRVDPAVVALVIVGGAAVVAAVSLVAVRLGGRLITSRPDTEDAE